MGHISSKFNLILAQCNGSAAEECINSKLTIKSRVQLMLPTLDPSLS